jgi:hypothetical protein
MRDPTKITSASRSTIPPITITVFELKPTISLSSLPELSPLAFRARLSLATSLRALDRYVLRVPNNFRMLATEFPLR